MKRKCLLKTWRNRSDCEKVKGIRMAYNNTAIFAKIPLLQQPWLNPVLIVPYLTSSVENFGQLGKCVENGAPIDSSIMTSNNA